MDSQIEQLLNDRVEGTWSVNDQGLVDVDGDINLYWLKFSKLPVNFGKVSGYFRCDGSQLTTLEGAPKEVGGNFWCDDNQLTTLKGAPKEVRYSFWCQHNRLTNLEGVPLKIGGSFWCDEHLHSDPEYKKYLIKKKLSDL